MAGPPATRVKLSAAWNEWIKIAQSQTAPVQSLLPDGFSVGGGVGPNYIEWLCP